MESIKTLIKNTNLAGNNDYTVTIGIHNYIVSNNTTEKERK